MDGVNKTLYIPLYGKVEVSRKGIILQDMKAEEIWKQEGFELKGKAKSKWLAYYMGMRSAVFDNWLRKKMEADSEAVILHIGCGMDSRIVRVGNKKHTWYDIDFPDVITERKKYYQETANYHMLEADAREIDWIEMLPSDKNVIVIMEGVSMYMTSEELCLLFGTLRKHFSKISLLVDCYTEFAAKASKYKNPINVVGVTESYGVDNPESLEISGLSYMAEYEMTPLHMIEELQGFERSFFKIMFGGSIARKMYRLYEYESEGG